MTLLMLIGFSMANAVEVEVGTMETNKLTNQFPTNPFFAYSLTQQIYYAGEMGGTAGSLTSISFYRDWTSESIDELKMSGLKLYLKHVGAKTKFDSDTDMVPVEESDLYWNGTLSAPAVDYKGWVTINLDKPFQYNGYENLLVCFYDTNPGKTESNTNKFYYVATGDNTALTYFSNDVVPDLANINEFAGTKLAMGAHNWVKFEIGDYSAFSIIDNSSVHNLPIDSYYKYSLSEQIYTAEEIGESRTINSISFYNMSPAERIRNINLYLVQTDHESFEVSDFFINFTNANMVFSGDVTFVSGDWTTIPFDIPFNYSDESNLAVIMVDNTGDDPGSTHFLSYPTATDQALNAATDATPLDASKLDSYYFYGLLHDKNKIRINEGAIIKEQTSALFPINVYMNYSITQQIYLASEMGSGYSNTLSSISFYNAGSEQARNLDLYLVHTNQSEFTTNKDFINFTAADKVFSGKVTFKQGEWTAIRFDKYFDYNGIDNLAVIVDDNTGTWTDNKTSCSVLLTASDQSFIVSTDGSDLSASNLSNYTGGCYGEKNQVRFNDKGLNFAPTGISITDITFDAATVSWDGRGSMWNFQYKSSDDEDWTTVEGLTQPTYQMTGLQGETDYTVRVQGNDNGDLSEWAETRFNTLEHYPRPTDVTAMEITPYSAILKWTENCGVADWQLFVANTAGDEKYVDAGSNPFVLTGLKQGMEYYVWVRSVIDAENEIYGNWSDSYFIYTPEANPAPNLMAIDAIPGGATLVWGGESDSYTVRYRKYTPPATVYFFDDFEYGDLASNGWTVYTDGEAPWPEGWFCSGYYMDYHSGEHGATSRSKVGDSENYNADNWLITPQVTLNGMLSFWQYGEEGFPDNYEVLLSTTGNAESDFTTVLRPMGPTVADWNEVTFDLSAYEGQLGYIAIHHVDNGKFMIIIDDFRIGEKVVEEPWQTVETKDKTITIEGLDYDTEYEVEVLGVMKGLEDSSTGPYLFTTLVKHPAPAGLAVNPAASTADITWQGFSDMYEVKYREISEVNTFFEDFESGDLTTNGWKGYANAEHVPGHEGWYVTDPKNLFTSATTHSGSNVVVAHSYYYDGSEHDLVANNWLITPQVELKGTLKFWQWAFASYRDSYEVLLSTTGNAESDFTTVLRILAPAEAGWNEVAFDLSAYEGQMGYIAIHHQCSAMTYLFIDDFRICEPSEGPWVTKYSTKPEITLRDLKPGTTYDVQVIGTMTGEPNAESTICTFKTREAEPIDLVFDNEGPNGGGGHDIFFTYDNTYANVTIDNLTLKSGVWQAICLPFDVDVENSPLAGTDVRTIGSAGRQGKYFVIDCLTPQYYMNAGRTYIVKWNGSSDLVNPTFKNVDITSDQDILYSYESNAWLVNSTYYLFTSDTDFDRFFVLSGDNGTTLTPLLTGNQLKAFEGYIGVYASTYGDAEALLLNTGDNDIITGISELSENSETSEKIYNIAGQRLNKAQKGINIVNGRKVLVK